MDRHNPYEAAFEAYLNEKGLCYVGVDEKKRSSLDNVPVKNLDFIVLGARGTRLLIDVKGRRFPGGAAPRERRVWENWTTQEDIHGLDSWGRLFGAGYVALFVFMYRIGAHTQLPGATDLWTWQDERYRLLAVSVEDYRRHMRSRSPRWGTVHLAGSSFRSLARPFSYFSQPDGGFGDTFKVEDFQLHEQDSDRRCLQVARLARAASPGGGAENGRGWC